MFFPLVSSAPCKKKMDVSFPFFLFGISSIADLSTCFFSYPFILRSFLAAAYVHFHSYHLSWVEVILLSYLSTFCNQFCFVF